MRLNDALREISNENRMRIMEALGDGSLRLTDIAKELGVSPQETSRHLSRLVDLGLVTRQADSGYSVSLIGRQLLSQLSGVRFLTEHADYFRSHTVEYLPSEFRSRLGELTGSVYRDEIMTSFYNAEKAVGEAEERVWVLSDQVLMSMIPFIEDFIGRGGDFRIILPENLRAPKDYLVFLSEGRHEHSKTDRRAQGVHQLVFICDDRGFTCFPREDGSLGYRGFGILTEDALGWCVDLFSYYWDTSEELLYP